MTLRISIVEGPGAGEVFEFGDEVEVVEIGRDPEHCQVVFPADHTVVGRRHLGIRRSLGSYKLETKSQNPVRIDGREPFDLEPLGQSHEIVLGKGGPRLRIETTMQGALPATEWSGEMRAPSRVAEGQGKGLRRVAAGLGLLAVLALVGWGVLYVNQAQAERELLALVTELDSQEPVDVLSPGILQQVSRSTYLVLMQDEEGLEDPIGTAWVADEGVLGTNAHVAEVFEHLGEGERLVVRSTVEPFATVPVAGVLLHPDYHRFREAWERRQPVRSGTDTSFEEVDSPGAGYDVALMYPEEGHALEPPLPIADASALEELTGGRAVAFAGFPMEMLAGGGVHPAAPVPQVQVGHVTAVSDYFLLPTEFGELNLIQHSLPTTGGASGSPVVDSQGRVVAVISGMNIIVQGSWDRAPSAAGINFAQRASLITELLEGPNAEEDPVRVAAWERGFATYDDPVELIPQYYYSSWLDELSPSVEPSEVFRRDGVLDALQEVYATSFSGVVSEPGYYLAIAVSRARLDIDMSFSRQGQSYASDTHTDWYPVVWWRQDPGDPALDVVVFAHTAEQPDFELTVWWVPTQAVQ